MPDHTGALEILARADLQRGPARAEEINRGSHPRRDVLVAVDATSLGDDDRCRQKARRPFLLLRKPAPCEVEPYGALQRHAAAGPSVLREHGVPTHTCVVHPGRDRLRQLVRHAVVDAVADVLIVGHPRAIVGHQRVLKPDSQAVRGGDARKRGPPEVRAGICHAEVLRSVDQSRNVAVRGAAVGALLGDADEIARGIRLAFEISDAEERAAEARLEPQVARQGRGIRRLGHVERPAEHAHGFRRNPLRLRQTRRRAGARAAQRLGVPEHRQLVSRRHLPGDAAARVLERPVRILGTTIIGLVQPLRGIAGIQVEVNTADFPRARARMRSEEIPEAILPDRSAHRARYVVDPGERRGRHHAHVPQHHRHVVGLQPLSCTARIDGAGSGVAAALRHDVHHQSCRLDLA